MVYLGGAVLAGIMKVGYFCPKIYLLCITLHCLVLPGSLANLLEIYSTGIIMFQDQPDFWITKQEYEEEGMNCLRKCGQA